MNRPFAKIAGLEVVGEPHCGLGWRGDGRDVRVRPFVARGIDSMHRVAVEVFAVSPLSSNESPVAVPTMVVPRTTT